MTEINLADTRREELKLELDPASALELLKANLVEGIARELGKLCE